jgi:hypothetical protein
MHCLARQRAESNNSFHGSLRQAAAALGGDVVGGQVICPGPGHSRNDRSLAVRFTGDGFIVYSFCNDNIGECRDHVRERLGLGDWRSEVDRQVVRDGPPINHDSDDLVTRIRYARSIWNATKPARGTLIERYLVETRRLELPNTPAIRFHANLKHDGQFRPAMVCALVDIRTNEFCGVHRTFLSDDAQKLGNRTLGRKYGAVIKIDPDERVTAGLAIAEGVETTIAARRIYRPAWCVVDANGIRDFPVLPAIEHLEIFADNDLNKTGEEAARACCDRWQHAGAEVQVNMPQTPGLDFADIISKNPRKY